MWKMSNRGLVHMTDESRKIFRTSISKQLLDEMQKVAEEKDTFVNYMFEEGLQKLIQKNDLDYDKSKRPKDRIQYNTTYNAELLEKVRTFAKERGLNINDVIEASIHYMEFTDIKNSQFRYRIER